MNALAPLSALFGIGVRVRNELYDRDLFHARKLQWPVVSVGNIRAGGTGKTPFVIALGKLLQEKGLAFDILSRGYCRDNESTIALVDPAGSPAEFGDEPLLMSQKLGVPVIVGANRFAAGQFAEKTFADLKPAHGSNWLHLLDDGFQHRKLHRDFDIVLVSPTETADSLLPTGRLREPLSALQRADAVVLVDDATSDGLRLEGKQVWRARRILNTTDLPFRPIAFCGIARPELYFANLLHAGVNTAAELAFPDHVVYQESDIRALLKLRDQNNANGFVTTEKDLINLKRVSSESVRQLHPLKAVSMEVVIEEPAAVLTAILQACAMPQSAETINRSPVQP
jgi:tetraacyldisaccharide 4'-kinase